MFNHRIVTKIGVCFFFALLSTGMQNITAQGKENVTQCYNFLACNNFPVCKWNDDVKIISYTFDNNFNKPEYREWRDAINAAANAWNEVLRRLGIDLQFREDQNSANIITLVKKPEEKCTPAQSFTTCLGMYIQQVRMEINTACHNCVSKSFCPFTTKKSKEDSCDIQGIATHEFGHWLGLADVDATLWEKCKRNSVMVSAPWLESTVYALTFERRKIKTGDMEGLKALYSHRLRQCVTIAVDIEEHIIRPVPDPAAETAVVQKLIEQGFRVVRQEFSSGQPDILIKGEAFAQSVGRIGALEQARARIEVKVIRSSTGETIASEGLHAGGVDVNLDLAAKRAFQRAGEKLGERLARLLAQYQCNPISPPPPPKKRIGVNVFESRVHLPDWDGEKMKEEVEKALSKRGVHFAVSVDADVIISGTITDYKVIYKDFGIPILNLFIRTGITYMTVEPQVFDLETGEMIRGEPISDFASGVEILGFKFGFGAQAVAEKIASKIVSWVETRVLPKYR